MATDFDMSGFVRVCGYNEDDLERARQEGAGSVSEIPSHIGSGTVSSGSTAYKTSYYPNNGGFTTHKSVVSYVWVYSTGGATNPDLSQVNATIEAATQSDPDNYRVLWSKAAWGSENVVHDSGDTSLASGGGRWGVTILPANVRIRVRTRAHLQTAEQGQLIPPFATSQAFIYENGTTSTESSISDSGVTTNYIVTVAEGEELWGFAASQEQAQQIADAVGITLVSYSNGIVKYHTEEDLTTVIARAKAMDLDLNINSVTTLSPESNGLNTELGGGGV